MIRTRPAVVLAVLFAGAFVMGCAEMLVIGMLDLVADDLRVSVPAAGALVTANALGLAVGGPALTFASTRLDRRTVVLGAAAAFVLLGLVPVLAPDYALFLAARALIGAVQGLFIAAALTVAASVVPAARTGRAMAVVISGFASASAFGLPLGTLLGQAVGWRGSFAVVVGIGAAVLAAAVLVVPPVPASPAARPLGQARLAFAPPVLAVLAFCALTFTAIQAALTYLVPYLVEVSGVPAALVSAFLLAYGVATTVGSALGGRFADADAARALILGSIGVTGALALMWFLGATGWIAAVAVLGMGLFGMGMAPSMQHRVVQLAGAGAPLASSLPSSAVNVGIAAGSLVGGLAITTGGIASAPFAGLVVAVLAVAAAVALHTLTPDRQEIS